MVYLLFEKYTINNKKTDMKKVFLAVSIIAALASCGTQSDSTEVTTTDSTVVATDSTTVSADTTKEETTVVDSTKVVEEVK